MSVKLSTMLLFSIFSIVLLQCETVQGEYQLEYAIEVQNDGSATWTIEQKGVSIQPSFDTFVKNVSLLVDTVKEKTQRYMSTENLKMNASFLGSYKVVTYEFRWTEFAYIENSRITIGDAFKVKNFFSYLYGDGAVCIIYPEGYTVESVSPQPHEWKDSIQMLEWYGIEDFEIGEPKVVLTEKSASGFMDIIGRNSVLIFSLLALISGGSISLYYFRFRKKKIVSKGTKPQMPEFPRTLGIEDDEEKVVNLLRAAGGRLYQSTIADRCEFSRSKTSKLLKIMEDKEKIRREEKGREKIVTLLEEVKGDKR